MVLSGGVDLNTNKVFAIKKNEKEQMCSEETQKMHRRPCHSHARAWQLNPTIIFEPLHLFFNF
jgi:hypothetical protein